MLLYPFGRMTFFKATVSSALLALSQLAVATGYFVEKRRAA